MEEFFVLYRGWLILLVVIVALALAITIVLKYAFRYSLTEEDRKIILPGDDYIDGAREPRFDAGGFAITIDAPAELVWQHIRQFGQDRAGWYSFERLERLCTFKIHNHYTIHPEWQDIYPGRFLFYHQPPWGLGSLITEVDESNFMFASVSDSRKKPEVTGSIHFRPPLGIKYFCWTWNFGAVDLGNGTTRYISKAQLSFEPYTKLRIAVVVVVLGIPSLIMGSHHMNLLKRICEGKKTIDSKHI